MQLPPLDVIATWPVPNYVNPTDVRGPTIIILTMIFLPLLVILILLRIYTRLRLSKNFGVDDIAIIAAVFPTAGCAIVALVAVLHYGWSRHVWDVPPDQLVTGLKFVIAVEILFVAGASLTKVSMLLLINRIMASGSSTLRYISMVLMVIVCVDCVIYLIVAINTCSPVSEYWTLSFSPQNCINERAHLLAGGVINTTTDFCVVLIPIPVVLKLRLPLRQRIACAMLFGAGFIVCIAAGVRMYYTWQLNTTYDKTWLAYPVWISGTIELYLGIIATSIPAIKPLVSRFFPKILGSGNFSKYGQPSLNNISNNNNNYVMSNNDPRIEHINNSSPSPSRLSHQPIIEQIPHSKPTAFETVTTITAGKTTRHLSFSPPFPTYKRSSNTATGPKPPALGDEERFNDDIESGKNAGGAGEEGWNHAVTPWEKTSSKTSLSSFEVGRQSVLEEEEEAASGVGVAVSGGRRVESRENLMVGGIGSGRR